MRPIRTLVAVIAALALGIAAAACGDDSKDTPQEVGIPVYEPSDVVSEAPGSTVLESPDSVETVHNFYRDFVSREGWDIVSEDTATGAANMTIKKSDSGSNIAIARKGEGSLISISTYPA